MTRKKRIFIIAAGLVALLCGCGGGDHTEVKAVEAEKFTDLIFQGDCLLPNTEFSWNMSEEDFLSKVHGADTMRPDSEDFDEYRYFHSEETDITTFTPPVSCVVDGIPGEADVAFAFDEKGLYQAGYTWIFEEDEMEKASEAAGVLEQDLNACQYMTSVQGKEQELAALEYDREWSPADGTGGAIRLAVLEVRSHPVVQLTVEISD